NWTSPQAFRVARFLYFYRLVGVTAFELSGWRPLLLIFPNTFEYFFIAYELVRTRRNPIRYTMRFWVWVAAAIWVFVKLPQEWWIHVAQLDFTDELKERVLRAPGTASWAEGVQNRRGVVRALLPLIAALVFVGLRLSRRLPPPAWPFTVDSDVVAR